VAAVKPISREEYDARSEALARHLKDRDLSGAVLFDPYYVLYYAGFAFAPTERPIAFFMSATGERGMMVPRLEEEHARAKTGFDRIVSYVEYPGPEHPMSVLAGALRDAGIAGRIGVDTDGYPRVLGYRGPTLSEAVGATTESVTDFVEDRMAVKSPTETDLIRESAVWGNLAHRLLQRYTKPGVTETEVSDRASREATDAMLDALGELYQSQSWFGSGASAGYRGQIGRNAAIPHALANNIVFQPGDVLVTGAGAPMWGYGSELERTMIIGKPTSRQVELFDHMVAVQDTALDAIRPGARCSDVDRAVRKYFEDNDLMPHWRHHSGHAIGLRYHEGPFLDTGDHTEIKPGMVFTVEPGIYDPAVGGFRHSDTVLVTDDGIEMLTYYPRDLESLTLPDVW